MRGKHVETPREACSYAAIMRHNFLRISSLSAIVFALSSTSLPVAALARPLQDAPVAQVLVAAAPIGVVTLYQGRAMISRTADAPEAQGLFELRFERLPPSLDPASLQATVVAPHDDCKLLDVRYEERVSAIDVTNSPELKQAIADLQAAMRERESIELHAALLNDQNTLLNSIAAKTATESAKDFGSKALDPTALAGQVAYLASARGELIDQRTKLEARRRENTDISNEAQAKVQALGGQTKVERSAIVSIGRSSNAPASVTLKYLVGEAGWAPRYAVRADMESAALVVEYNAEIRQTSGEDWKDVALTLSTAQPTQRAQPMDVASTFVDVYVPPPPVEGRRFAGVADAEAMSGYARADMPAPASKAMYDRGGAPGGPGGPMEKDAALEAFFSDAQAVSSGAVVNFPLPRAVSIPSDSQKSRSLRITSVETEPTFTHVARPLVESAVYIKAVTANKSSFQFLAGPATVFLGGDSVGKTTLPDLAPGAEMTFWLGTDPRITAERVLVKKDASERGMFGKSDVMDWDYRVNLKSTSAQPMTVEVFDRMPVSRNEKIQIQLLRVSPALEANEQYVEHEKPQGFLKWTVRLPGRKSDEKAVESVVLWSVQLTKPKDITMTGNPE